jgi:hypothetical protein
MADKNLITAPASVPAPAPVPVSARACLETLSRYLSLLKEFAAPRGARSAGEQNHAQGDARFRHYSRLLEEFVALHAGVSQRSPAWYLAMATTVGGSEMAALMGWNPYATEYDVVTAKVASLQGGSTWTGGGLACWWGTLLEDTIEAYVALDLGSPVLGADICVCAVAGHRNSPDGYIVAKVYPGRDGADHLWTTNRGTDEPMSPRILLLEFKCPLTRQPTGSVPRQYTPQVWSGLAVSPVAHSGLFVDSVFRKCALGDLGDTPAYDTAFHDRDDPARAEKSHPLAWGLIMVYAPLLDAPLAVRLGWRGDSWAPGDPDPEAPDADAAQAAWQIHSAYFGLQLRGPTRDVADLGDMEGRLFARTLGLVDRKRFRVSRTAPCFFDGRGAALQTDRAIGAAVERARTCPPPGHWLLGVLPWKLFEVYYVPVRRRAGFMAEMLPLITEVHRAASVALASADPGAYLRERERARESRADGEAEANAKACANARASSPMDLGLQDLFDSI